MMKPGSSILSHILRTGTLAGVLLVCASSAASERYEAAPAAVPLAHSHELFRAWSIDTGWQPASGPVQVRLMGDLGGGLNASAPGQAHLSWPERELRVEGEPMEGSLSMNMGVELHVYMRLDLEIAPGVSFAWEGPIPAVPQFDYRLAGTSAFTPYLLPDAQSPSVVVSDAIQRTEIFSVPLTSAIIPIPGIEGTLDVLVGGSMDVSMWGRRLVLPTGEIAGTGAFVGWSLPSAPELETRVSYEADMEYRPALELVPEVVLHVGPVGWTLASFPIPVELPALTETWAFAEQPISFALPRLDVRVDGVTDPISAEDRAMALDLGQAAPGTRSERTLHLTNTGHAPMQVTLSLSGSGFTLGPGCDASLEPGQGMDCTVALERSVEGVYTGALVIDSNDPAGGVTIALSGTSVVQPVPEPIPEPVPEPVPEPPSVEPGTPGGAPDPDGEVLDLEGMGCACSTSSATAPLLALLVAALLASQRRRRTCPRPRVSA